MKVGAEARLVALCTREPNTVTSDELRNVVADVRDWQFVADLAIRHRVAAYVLDADTGVRGRCLRPRAAP